MPHRAPPSSPSAFSLDRRTLLSALLPAGLLAASASAPHTAPAAAPPAPTSAPAARLGAMHVVGWSAHRLA